LIVESEVIGKLIAEGNVSIRPDAEVFTVNPDLAILINPVKIDEHFPVPLGFRYSEVLAVPSDTAGETSPLRTGRMFCTEVSLDTPVVRQVEKPPFTVNELGILAVLDVSQVEPPIPAEVLDDPCRIVRRGAADGSD
jgi:hypothetical protein